MLDIYFCHPGKNILFVAVSFSRVQFILSNCACNVSNVSVYVEFYYDGTSAGMTPRYHHRPRLNYEDDEDCVEWQRARDDEAQTDAFQCRLTARLVNLIFFSRHVYYRRVQFCERGKEREGETQRRQITDPRSLNSRCRCNNAAHVCRERRGLENNASACVSRAMTFLVRRWFFASTVVTSGTAWCATSDCTGSRANRRKKYICRFSKLGHIFAPFIFYHRKYFAINYSLDVSRKKKKKKSLKLNLIFHININSDWINYDEKWN